MTTLQEKFMDEAIRRACEKLNNYQLG